MSPLVNFSCPDNVVRPISECLVKCPRPEGRCLAMAHLVAISQQREWTGTASVTQLIKPTRIAYLEIVKDYDADPDDFAFMIYGTLLHKRLEVINKKLEGLSEHRIYGPVSGAFDRLEPDELKEGWYKLIDFKLTGASAIAKALGLNGKEPDAGEWELQLNKYCGLIEDDPELSELFPISRLLIQATVRDSGLRQIQSLGIPKRMPLIPVKRLDKDFVKEYFSNKDLLLHQALETKTLPVMCSYSEHWGSRRCKDYCMPAPFCPEGAKLKKVALRE